jgi:putative FmdB family regulatory protein
MPIYEYECKECGEPFEKMVRFSEADFLPACPKCESKETRKKISAVVSFGSSGYGMVSASGSNCGSAGGSGGFT